MLDFIDLLETLTDPAMRHAALIHLPVAIAMVGMVLAVAIAVTRGRSVRLAALTAVVFALLALVSWAAVTSGVDAKAVLGAHSAEASRLVSKHEWMARRLWIFAMSAAGVASLGLIPLSSTRALVSVLAPIAGCAVITWVALTAHPGGELVYRHAAGVVRESAAAETDLPEIPDARAAFYQKHIAPLLADRCLGCHSGDTPAAGIDLGSIASLLDGGSDAAVVPGHPDRGLLMQTVLWTGEIKMPPPDDDGSGRLDDEAIEDLRQWISAGAAWAEGRGPGRG